jgi:hypothetical protein
MTSNCKGSIKYLTDTDGENTPGLYISDGTKYQKVMMGKSMIPLSPDVGIVGGAGINVEWDGDTRTLTISRR